MEKKNQIPKRLSTQDKIIATIHTIEELTKKWSRNDSISAEFKMMSDGEGFLLQITDQFINPYLITELLQLPQIKLGLIHTPFSAPEFGNIFHQSPERAHYVIGFEIK